MINKQGIEINQTFVSQSKGVNIPLGNGHSEYIEHSPEIIEYDVKLSNIDIKIETTPVSSEEDLFNRIKLLVNNAL